MFRKLIIIFFIINVTNYQFVNANIDIKARTAI